MISLFGIMQTNFAPFLQKLPPRGLTFRGIYDKFSPVRGCEKDMPPRRSLREKPVGARLCRFAAEDTTLEPWSGNALPGAPVKASMSGSASCNQGGTVEYFVSHP